MKKQKIINNFVNTATINKQKINTDIIITSGNKKWYKRLWFIVSNPFCYIFGGYIRY